MHSNADYAVYIGEPGLSWRTHVLVPMFLLHEQVYITTDIDAFYSMDTILGQNSNAMNASNIIVYIEDTGYYREEALKTIINNSSFSNYRTLFGYTYCYAYELMR